MSGSRGVDQGVYTAESRRDAKLDAFIALVRLDPEGVGAFISSLDKRPPESWPAYFASLWGPRPPPDPEPSHAPDPAANEADDAMDWATTPEQVNSLDNAKPLTIASPATPSSSPSRSSSSSSSSSSPSSALSTPVPRSSPSTATITPDTTGRATNEREKDGMEVDEAASEDQHVASSAGTSPQHVLPPASKRQKEKQQPPAKKRKRDLRPSSSSSSSSPSSPTTRQSTSSSSSASLLQPAPVPASSTPSTSTSTPPQVPTPPAPPPPPPAAPSTAPLVLPSFRRKRAGEVDSLPLDFLYPHRIYTPSEEVPIRPPPLKVTPNFIPSRFIHRPLR
ncbi:hypothetical protein RTBOTA2_001936 [Rhodotorula toruloides]|uniref:Uncharacterized protein n=1 Tax=Rhodotorula toruloides TaxID=5286 RepID=A0A2T0A5Q8_RHOTO|nr:hypothetical protein RTBOTA2_001936 [Rhodotorula toruloides]PRQ73361.1 hypothetical protein AAT19DRAFT_16114 [Rhodotorula toruloides]